MEKHGIPAVAALCATLIMPLAAAAQPAEDPSWPCIQRKVETLSLGLMWPHPVEAAEPDAEQKALIETLALRRVSLDEAKSLVGDYAASHPDLSEQDLGVIFEGVFERLSKERRRLVNGIERYAESQQTLSRKIDEERVAFREAEAVEPPDYDQLDKLEAEMDWNERIFHDRAQSLTYVCETPVLIEQRLYAIAQILLQAKT
ncbi:hypothetical protein [Rhodobacteraceae bacterium DSL-40]|uniref:hypothetical protein n=1 Tax=Amaricoccus sp. B4 TaxID=3368557 RepID=UPI000DABD747